MTEDVFFLDEYSKLLEFNGSWFDKFVYEQDGKTFQMNSIRKKYKLPFVFNNVHHIVSAESPYGYSGPWANCADIAFLKSAVESYRSYAKEKGVLCEFIRFNPFHHMQNLHSLFDFVAVDRKISIMMLNDKSESDPIGYSKKTRYEIRRAERQLTVDFSNCHMDEFIRLYYQTMDRNNANKSYYFPRSYFVNLFKQNFSHLISILYKNRIISSAVILCDSDSNAYYHLSANDPLYSHLGGNYFLIDKASQFASRLGAKRLVLGGGRTNLPDDALWKFKTKFTKYAVDFKIGGWSFYKDEKKSLNRMLSEYFPGQSVSSNFQSYREYLD